MTIRQSAIIQNLQQHIKYVGVGFLYLIQQDDRVRFAPNRLGQITTFFITDITWRSTDQPGNRVFFHELRHIDAYQRILGIEQKCGQRFRQFGLANAGRPEKQE